MQVILLRHGRTDWNEQELIQGKANRPLDDVGRAQARAAVDRLRPYGIRFFATSPLDRAWETTYIVSSGLGVAGIMLAPGLMECDFGQFEGKSYAEFDAAAGEHNLRTWHDPFAYDFTPFGGESAAQVRDRHLEVIEALKKRYADSTVAVVGHGRGLRTLAATKGLRPAPHFKNCQHHVLDF
jgi:broad specificity phosphatase PhoE